MIHIDYRQITRGWENGIKCNVVSQERVYNLMVALARHERENALQTERCERRTPACPVVTVRQVVGKEEDT